MNEVLITRIVKEIIHKGLYFGQCTITFSFHDNRVCKYTIETTETHNVISLKRKEEDK